VFVLGFSGCDPSDLAKDFIGEETPVPEEPKDPPGGGGLLGGSKYVPTGNLVSAPDIILADKSIKEKFKGSQGKTGQDGVTKAFLELSAFIKKNGLTNGATQNVIKLGDYIDLEGGLRVENYNQAGAFWSEYDIHWDKDLKLGEEEVGKMMRLIVVGINSFQPKSPNKYQYQGTDTPPQHVVFQFQHVPVVRYMNPVAKNEGGYPDSEMRKYLTPVKDGSTVVAGTGNFLAGLLEAGLPEDVLWGPSRLMATKLEEPGTVIDDLLWLPTEREMFGDRLYSVAAVETETTQARLEYYAEASLKKLSSGILGYPDVSGGKSQSYWLASMYGGEGDGSTDFCRPTSGNPYNGTAVSPLGVYGGQ
jgi:hypothetical protein